jgi:hypothetical protein
MSQTHGPDPRPSPRLLELPLSIRMTVPEILPYEWFAGAGIAASIGELSMVV